MSDVPFHAAHFEAYFAPTSRSRMTKFFRASESLGESAGKKWSHNLPFLFIFADFALQNIVETTLPDGIETSGLRAYR